MALYDPRSVVGLMITAGPQRKSENHQKRHELELYHALTEYASDLVAILEPDGTFRYASPSYQQILGFLPSDLQGTNAFDHVSPDDVSTVRDAFIRGLQSEGTPVCVQFRYRDAYGAWHVIESTGSNHLADPLIRGFVVNSRDITESARAEEQLRQSEACYRGIVESAFDGLVITNLDGVIVEANPAAQRMFGYASGELIGTDMATIIHADSHGTLRTYGQTVTTQGWAQMGLIGVRKDGTSFHVEARGTQLVYSGRPHILAVVRDDTEQIEAEAAVIEERKRLARELHDSVSQALYSIALGATTARALLKTDPARSTEPLTFVLDQARVALDDMRALVFDLQPEGLERMGLVEGLGRQAETLRVRHGIDARVAMCTEPQTSMAVKAGLHRIAQEALHNVVKHAEASVVCLSLTCEDEEIVLKIQDDGKGFDTEASFPGHLGLRTMNERAERLGGSHEVESTPGAGTIMRARVPHRLKRVP